MSGCDKWIKKGELDCCGCVVDVCVIKTHLFSPLSAEKRGSCPSNRRWQPQVEWKGQLTHCLTTRMCTLLHTILGVGIVRVFAL